MRMVEWEALDIAWKKSRSCWFTAATARSANQRVRARPAPDEGLTHGVDASSLAAWVLRGLFRLARAPGGRKLLLFLLEGRCAFASKTENHRGETVGDRRPLGQRKIKFRQHLSGHSGTRRPTASGRESRPHREARSHGAKSDAALRGKGLRASWREKDTGEARRAVAQLV